MHTHRFTHTLMLLCLQGNGILQAAHTLFPGLIQGSGVCLVHVVVFFTKGNISKIGMLPHCPPCQCMLCLTGWALFSLQCNAETVAVDGDGSLLLLDKHNFAWRARPAGAQDYELDNQPFAHLGRCLLRAFLFLFQLLNFLSGWRARPLHLNTVPSYPLPTLISGTGRPLGFKSANGSLFICNSNQVRGHAGVMLYG